MKFFFNMTTKAKLLSCFAIVILINLFVSVSTLTSLTNINQISHRLDDTLNLAFTRIYNIQTAVDQVKFIYITGLNEKDTRVTANDLMSQGPAAIDRAAKALAVLNPEFLGTDAYRQGCLKLRETSSESIQLLNERIMPMVRQGQTKEALDRFLVEVYPVLAEVTVAATDLYRQQTQYCLSLTNTANDPTMIYIDMALTALSVIIAIALALFMANYISRALSTQISLLEKLANGDFSSHIHEGYLDEFGHSHDVIRSMRNSLSNIINMTKKECNHLQSEMRALQQISHGIASTSSDIQSQAVTVAAAADEMVSTTADIARNCETAAAGSNRCKEITNDGVQKVSLAVDNIRQQADHTKDNAAKIESLAKQTHEIGSIVSTIDDIAAQTNLLALNAAIEAARAGEAGRGFAVVADEVRALASRTTKSTQEISKMVKNIQEEAKMATESINASVANMDTVAGDAQGVMQVLQDITDHVNDVNNQITQIATAAEQQTTATSEISSHMQTVTNVTSEMADNANKQFNSMETAYNDLNKLNEALAFFKTRDTEQPTDSEIGSTFAQRLSNK